MWIFSIRLSIVSCPKEIPLSTQNRFVLLYSGTSKWTLACPDKTKIIKFQAFGVKHVGWKLKNTIKNEQKVQSIHHLQRQKAQSCQSNQLNQLHYDWFSHCHQRYCNPHWWGQTTTMLWHFHMRCMWLLKLHGNFERQIHSSSILPISKMQGKQC